MGSFNSNGGGSTIVIFGASGDLTRRKLIPAIYNNFRKKRLPAGLRIIGFARRNWSDEQFRDHLRNGAKEHDTSFDQGSWDDFVRCIRYFRGNIDDPGDYRRLQSFLGDVEKGTADRLYYLATAPDLYGLPANICLPRKTSRNPDYFTEYP